MGVPTIQQQYHPIFIGIVPSFVLESVIKHHQLAFYPVMLSNPQKIKRTVVWNQQR
jgi:hypothetical protein